MDMLPVPAMTPEQREDQYLVDVTRENTERRNRTEAPLDPSQQGTRDNRYATYVAKHERLFTFSDNLTTLMFTVAQVLFLSGE